MLVRPLLLRALNLMTSDVSIITPADLADAVRFFIIEDQEGFAKYMTSKSDGGYNAYSAGDYRLLGPVISGISPEILEESLTSIISAHLDKERLSDDEKRPEEDVSAVRKLFRRVLHARPPLMTKKALLLYLHTKHEEYCSIVDEKEGKLKQLSMLDCIEYCLTSKDDHWADAIKEALSTMLAEIGNAPLPRGMMRTAALATRAYPSTKKYVLTSLLPQLMKLKAWEHPKIWEGVAYCIKSLANSKDSEPTLRSVLGLPGQQLKVVVEIALNIKPELNKLLKSFSKEEYVEVVSGQWLFGEDIGKSCIDESGELNLDAEKAKIVRSIESEVEQQEQMQEGDTEM